MAANGGNWDPIAPSSSNANNKKGFALRVPRTDSVGRAFRYFMLLMLVAVGLPEAVCPVLIKYQARQERTMSARLTSEDVDSTQHCP
jgi:hypothetical protein